MSEKILIKKLAEVMAEIDRLPKSGFNTFHKYHYATEADVSEVVRNELAKRNVIMIPSVESCDYREHINRNNNVEYITTVKMEFTFIDGESGEQVKFTTYGEGQDAGDKGTYKAITGAQKYALMKLFMIPTYDDPEADTGTDERNAGNTHRQRTGQLSEAQVKRAFAIANAHGITAAQVKQAIMRDYNKTNVADLSKEEYDELCNKMESVKKGDESA